MSSTSKVRPPKRVLDRGRYSIGNSGIVLRERKDAGPAVRKSDTADLKLRTNPNLAEFLDAIKKEKPKSKALDPGRLPEAALVDFAIAWYSLLGEILVAKRLYQLLKGRYAGDASIDVLVLGDLKTIKRWFDSPQLFKKRDFARPAKIKSQVERMTEQEVQEWKWATVIDIEKVAPPKTDNNLWGMIHPGCESTAKDSIEVKADAEHVAELQDPDDRTNLCRVKNMECIPIDQMWRQGKPVSVISNGDEEEGDGEGEDRDDDEDEHEYEYDEEDEFEVKGPEEDMLPRPVPDAGKQKRVRFLL